MELKGIDLSGGNDGKSSAGLKGIGMCVCVEMTGLQGTLSRGCTTGMLSPPAPEGVRGGREFSAGVEGSKGRQDIGLLAERSMAGRERSGK